MELNSFYEQVLLDSNVVNVDHIEKELSKHTDFDRSSMSKDIREIDFVELSNGIDTQQISAKFELPEAKGGAKGKSTSIQSFKLKSGDIFGIGNSVRNNSLLLKGMKSFFTQHSYKFGDDEQKALLKKPLEELLLIKQSGTLTFGEWKKLMTFQVTFQLFSADKLFQSEEVIEQVKPLMLIKEMIGKLVKEDASIKALPQYKTNGFIQEKYNNFSKEDITQLTVNVELVPKFDEGVRQEAIVMVQYNAENNPVCTSLVDTSKTIEQIMNQVQMRTLDIVLYLDNCSTKKQGKEVSIIPKLQAVNIVLSQTPDQLKPKGHGLNLKKFNEILTKQH